MAAPEMRPSIIAEEASSMPETSPEAKMPVTLVAPLSSQTGTSPPRLGSSTMSQPAMSSSWLMGDRPTATQMVSTSKCFSVPGTICQLLSTSPIVTPVTWSVPSAETIVCERWNGTPQRASLAACTP